MKEEIIVTEDGIEIRPKKNRHLLLKIICIVLAVIIAVAAALGITFVCVWSDEIATVNSFKLLVNRNDENDEGSVYRMDVNGGFYFNDFLKSGGASNDSQLIKFITEHITRGLVKMEIGETDIGCSSFTAKTQSGDVLFARNYDFDKTNVCLTMCNPGGGRYKSFSTVDLNYVGIDTNSNVNSLMDKITCLAAPYAPLDGINEKGVSCGIYMSYQGNVRNEDNQSVSDTVATDQNEEGKKNITSTTMLRLVLDYADSVDKAIDLISQYNLHDSANTSFHYMIADPTKSAILEWVPEDGTNATDTDGSARKLKVTYSYDNKFYEEYRGEAEFQYQWVTNFIVSDGYYNDDVNKRGYDRYCKIYEQLKKTDGIVEDERAAMNILASVGRRTHEDSVSHSYGVTVHSVVYNLTQKTVLWVANEHYDDNEYCFQYSLQTGKLTRLS